MMTCFASVSCFSKTFLPTTTTTITIITIIVGGTTERSAAITDYDDTTTTNNNSNSNYNNKIDNGNYTIGDSSNNDDDTPTATDAGMFELNILHTGDLHSHFEKFNKTMDQCSDVSGKCYGGVARRAWFVKNFRELHENVILLDSGDQYQGTLWFFVFEGQLSRDFLDYMRYDVAALGTHEFDNELPGLRLLLEGSRTPIVCSNLLKEAGTPPVVIERLKPSVVLTRRRRKIGVIGYITPEARRLSSANFTFLEEVEVLQREASKLKSDGVDVIVALGHSGIEKDEEIATKIPDIDVVVGGHSHTLLYTGKNMAGDEVAGEYPKVFNHSNGRSTLLVHSGFFGKYVGVLKVVYDSKGKAVMWSGNPVLMDENVEEDKDAVDYLKSLVGEINGMQRIVVGHATVPLKAEGGNLLADAFVYHLTSNIDWKNITLAICNSGSIRSSFPSGEINCGSVARAFPFTGLIRTTLRGSVLRMAFEHSVKNFSIEKRSGKFLQVSGFRVKYDMRKPNGFRVVKVKVDKCYDCKIFESLNDNKLYEVAMPRFLFKGGDGYDMLKSEKFQSFDVLDMAVVINRLKIHSPLNSMLENRILGLETFPEWNETVKPLLPLNGSPKTPHVFFLVVWSILGCVVLN